MTRYTEALTQKLALANHIEHEPLLYIKALVAWEEHVLRRRHTPEQVASVLGTIHWMIDKADAYFMSDTISQALRVAAEALPNECQVHKESIPSRIGFLLLEEPLPPILNGLGNIHAFSWWQDKLEDEDTHACVLVCWDRMSGRLLPAVYLKITDGDTLQDLFNNAVGPEMEPVLRFIVSSFNFLEQQLLEPAKQTLPRQERRAVERKHPNHQPEVTIIRLRRKYVQHGTDETKPHREYEYQWTVRGHWRKQPYRSKGPDYYKHIYIAPYVKGPEDKPLKHVERVYAVVR